MTSVLEQYEEEIFQQGVEQDIQQRDLEFAESLLRSGEEVDFVVKHTSLDEDMVKQVNSRLKNH